MNCSEYLVVEVAEDALPEGHDWAIIDTPDAVIFAYVPERITPKMLAEAWAGYRRVMHLRPAPTPPRRYLWAV
jgi:hypothetical protein